MFKVFRLVLLGSVLLLIGYLCGPEVFERKRFVPIRDAPVGTTVSLDDLPIEGSSQAALVLIEFSDYECAFCSTHSNGVGIELRKEFIATGRLRHAFVNNPLSIHTNAMLLASAAICAGSQGHYWEMHDALFRTQPRTEEDIVGLGHAFLLDLATFSGCIKSEAPSVQIAHDVGQSHRLGLEVTPAFALGIVDKNGNAAIYTLVFGIQPIETFRRLINEIARIG